MLIKELLTLSESKENTAKLIKIMKDGGYLALPSKQPGYNVKLKPPGGSEDENFDRIKTLADKAGVKVKINYSRPTKTYHVAILEVVTPSS